MNRLTANSLMLLTALIWGTTFVAQQLSAKHLGPLAYTGARFLLGALFVLPLAWREYRAVTRRGVRINGADLKSWSGLGLLIFLGAYLQQVGIAITSVSNAGFLTGLYVPLVPFVTWLVERKTVHWAVWPCTLGSLLGAFLLSGGGLSALSEGDLWVIASTIFWASHVTWVGRVAAHKGLPVMLACVQFFVCGMLSLLLALLQEDNTWNGLWLALPTVVYGGLLSVGVAFTLQVVAQRYTHPVDAALLLSSELLFAALAGMLYLGERLGPIQWVGGAVIFVSIVAYQVLAMAGKREPAVGEQLDAYH